ncbi:unnamed protein product [Trichobilharzia regenti]|nr:unnamed protein product [Trichobilharzia regenti]
MEVEIVTRSITTTTTNTPILITIDNNNHINGGMNAYFYAFSYDMANDIPQSFINVNGDDVNKSTEECTLISNPQTLISPLSSSSSMSEAADGGGSTAGTSTDGGGVSTTSDDSASPIDSVLTASKIQQLQHDITQLEAAIKTNLNEQKGMLVFSILDKY